MGAMGSFVEGLAGGIQQGQKNAMLRQMQDAQIDLIKKEAKAKEAALVSENLKASILSQMSPDQQAAALFPKAEDSLASKLSAIQKFFGGGSPAPAPPEYVPGQGMPPYAPAPLPEQIAQGQIGTLGLSQEDLLQGVLKKELGVERSKFNRFAELEGPGNQPWVVPMDDRGGFDWSKAYPKAVKPDMQPGVGPGMAPTQTPVNPYNRQPVGAPIQTGAPPMRTVEMPTAGGGATSVSVPVFGGGGGGKGTGTAGGIRTALDFVDQPIPEGELLKWSDGKGNTAKPGETRKQALARGLALTQEGMPAESGGKAVMLSQAIGDVEKAIEMLLPEGKGFNRKLAMGASADAPEWVIKGSQIVRSSIENALSAKLRLETGATANPGEIINIASRFHPSGIKDNEESARYKLQRLLRFMKDGKYIIDPKGRILGIVEPPAGKGKPNLSLGTGTNKPKTWQEYKSGAK